MKNKTMSDDEYMTTEKINWEEMSNDEYITMIGNRIFRLKLGDRGILGIGKAYYLSTKTKDETEFKSYNNYLMEVIFKIAETYFKMY